MGLVICIGGVLILLMLLVCGEEINTFGPLHLIVLHCTLLYYIALGGQVSPTWWHTLFVCLSLRHWSSTREVCNALHWKFVSVSCVCSTVCVFAWCELHSGHNASWQYSNTHDMTPIIPICCLVYSALNTAPHSRSQFWAEMLTTVQLLLPQPWPLWVEPWEILTTQIFLLMRHFGQDFSS